MSRLFYGCVVDFIHFDIWRGEVFGKYVALFPIGNIADLMIIAGVVLILITQGKFHEVGQARELALHPASASGGAMPSVPVAAASVPEAETPPASVPPVVPPPADADDAV